MPKLIGLAEFGQFFETFEHSAWHLETRRGYAPDREDPGYVEFLSTGTAPCDLGSEWCVNIRRQTADGKYVGRVRVVDNPPTEGQLFLLDYAKCNAATGEDLRAWAGDIGRPDVFDELDARLKGFDPRDVRGDDVAADTGLVQPYRRHMVLHQLRFLPRLHGLGVVGGGRRRRVQVLQAAQRRHQVQEGSRTGGAGRYEPRELPVHRG